MKDTMWTFDYFSGRDPLHRSMKALGSLVKAGGMHGNNGSPVPGRVVVEQPASANPRPATLSRLRDQTQLKIDMKQNTPRMFLFLHWTLADLMVVMQGISFALFKGFISHLAAEQMVHSMYNNKASREYCQALALETRLINPLGFPETASFAAFGYCAAMHIDPGDAGATFAHVSKRTNQVCVFPEGY